MQITYIAQYCEKPYNFIISRPSFNRYCPISMCYQRYIRNAVINGQEQKNLRKSGSFIDVYDIISVEELLPDGCHLQMPSIGKNNFRRILGKITTKTAVKSSKLRQGFYFLSNKSAKLIENQKKNVCPINAFTRRGKKKHLRKRKEIQK